MVSAALVSNWIAEWDKSVDSRPGPLQMRLRVGWPSAPGDRQLTRAGDLQLMQADPATGGAKHGQDRTVVLTTSGSYSGHVAKILEKRWTTTEQVRADSRALNPKTRQVWHTADQVRWGRIIRDEAHKDEAATTTANQLIRRLRERQVSQDERAPAGTSLQGPSSVWFLSGTSIEVGPQDLTGLVACLDVNSSTWSQRIDGLERCIQAVLETLQVEFNRHVQSSNPAAKDLTDLEEGFSHVLRQLMIRRTIKTRWYDGLPCIRLPPFFARDVAVNVGARWFAKLEEIAEEVKARLYQEAAAQQKRWVQLGSKPDQKPKPTTNAYFRYANKLKVCSSFPYLKTMMEAHEVETLTLAELTPKKEPSWFVRAENPLTRRLPELVASSPKLEAIRRIMGRQGVDWQQRPEKLVIMSGSPYVAYIVYLWLQSIGSKAGLFHGGLSTAKRNEMVDAFNEEDDGPDVVVGTTGILGCGLSCTRAFRVILMEPDYKLSAENQAFAQVWRIGQWNAAVCVYRLHTKDLALDNLSMNRQERRQQFWTGALSFSAERQKITEETRAAMAAQAAAEQKFWEA